MGRQVKRVPLDFEWPLKEIWVGYLNPYRWIDCPFCRGSGYGPGFKKLHDEWYARDNTGHPGRYELTQDEVDALWEADCLFQFQEKPTAAEVNSLERLSSAAVYICLQQRAKRMGVPEEEFECSHCKGSGELYFSDEIRVAAENWSPQGPPQGDGYQMWETTSEGSPISPVFATPEELARWLADNGASSFGRFTATYEQWLKMINREWAPSLIMIDNSLRSGVEATEDTK